MQQRPLLELLGARWALGAAVAAVAWDAAGETAGFALADGTLALAPRSWPGAPRVAQRPGGGIELVPASAAPGPLVRLSVQPGGCRGIAAAASGGFVVLGSAGALAAVASDGAPQPLPPDLPDSVTLLAGVAPPDAVACGGGAVARWTQADGLQVWPVRGAPACRPAGAPAAIAGLTLFDDGHWLAAGGATQPLCWRLPQAEPLPAGPAGRHPVSAVAGHPGRTLLAAGYNHGVAVLCQPGSAEMLFLRAPDGDAVSALAWSADGRRLAIGTQGGEAAVLALPPALLREREAA